MNDPARPELRLPLPPDVNDLLASGAIVPCYYHHHPQGPDIRPYCEDLATVVYGPIALCASCDRARSAVGKGTAPRHLPDPAALVTVGPARAALTAAETALVTVGPARAALTAAETALAEVVTHARAAGHPWSAIAAALGVSRQAAQQRFTPARPTPRQP